jgi:hypothetical protein
MAASQGATDAQIADALRQGLPHLTDPASLQDQSFGKQPQGIGIHAEQGKTQAKLEFVLRQLAAMDSARCLITTLELKKCEMRGQDAERFAGVLAQCPALAHLDLSGNIDFGAAGAESLAGVLGQCRELVHLNRSLTSISAGIRSAQAGQRGLQEC